jgi:hypothetical protein
MPGCTDATNTYSVDLLAQLWLCASLIHIDIIDMTTLMCLAISGLCYIVFVVLEGVFSALVKNYMQPESLAC